MLVVVAGVSPLPVKHEVMQASVLHALLFAGSVFVALVVQSESATTVVTFTLCVALHELPVRAWVPPPQALSHAP